MCRRLVFCTLLLAVSLGCSTAPTRVPLPTALPRAMPSPTPDPRPTPVPYVAAGWRDRTLVRHYFWPVEGSLQIDRTPRLSPDGRYLLVQPWPAKGGRSSLALLDLETGKLREIASDPAWTHYAAFWSPDGRRIAYARFYADPEERKRSQSEIWVAQADGSQARRLWVGQKSAGGWPQVSIEGWSADGQAVLVSGRTWGHCLGLCWGGLGATGIRLDGLPTWQAPSGPQAPEPGSDAGAPWSFQGPPGDFSLRVVPDSGPYEQGTGEQHTRIERHDAATHQTRTLTSMPGSFEILSLSPTGSKLLFKCTTAEGAGSLWLMNTDGSGLRETSSTGGTLATVYNLRWSGDGCWLFATGSPVQAGEKRDATLLLDAASATWQIIYGAWQWPVSVSHDGRRLIVIVGAWDGAEIHLLEQVGGQELGSQMSQDLPCW